MGRRRREDSGAGRAGAFPLTVHVVHHAGTNSYGRVRLGHLTGLACFREAGAALAFAAGMETRGNLAVEVLVADACEIARSLRPGCRALVLADGPEGPRVQPLG